jgi:hypothetical protein
MLLSVIRGDSELCRIVTRNKFPIIVLMDVRIFSANGCIGRSTVKAR